MEIKLFLFTALQMSKTSTISICKIPQLQCLLTFRFDQKILTQTKKIIKQKSFSKYYWTCCKTKVVKKGKTKGSEIKLDKSGNDMKILRQMITS